jgi:hypothetical protein
MLVELPDETESEVKTWHNKCMMFSSKCWPRVMSVALTHRVLSVWMEPSEFFTWYRMLPRHGLSQSTMFYCAVSRSPFMLTVGLKECLHVYLWGCISWGAQTVIAVWWHPLELRTSWWQQKFCIHVCRILGQFLVHQIFQKGNSPGV